MAAWKLHLMHHCVKIFVITAVSVGCVAGTIYTVGDNSGWDISTDLDSWAQAKTFLVGDSLLFQYSSYHSLVELKQEDFETCNTSNPAGQQSNSSSSGGNATIPLTRPGERFFSCGNSLHCLGGMKLRVPVRSNQTSSNTVQPSGVSTAGAGPTSSLQGSSSVTNNIPPSSTTSSSASYTCHCCWVLLLGFLGCFIFGSPY